MKLTLIPPEERERRWARVRPPPEQRPTPPPLNLDAVLEIGEAVYFTFRGRPYGVPPLPWREGERILNARLTLTEIGRELPDGTRVIEREHMQEYYRHLRTLQDVLWDNTRTVGTVRRFLRRLRLARNPYRQATETEIVKLADFFFGRRMSSTGIRLPGAPDPVT